MPKPPRRGDVVEVHWVDSERIGLGWSRPKRYRQAARRAPDLYRTSGYWIDKVKGRVVIVQSLSFGNHAMTDVMSIPKVAVTRIVVLGRADRRARRALR